jgi:Arm DNA-binding domain
MPRIKLTTNAIDPLPTPKSDVICWDVAAPGFGVRSRPSVARFLLFCTAPAVPARSLRKYIIGPYGRVTLDQARVAAQKVFAAKLEGRDPAGEKCPTAPLHIPTKRSRHRR